MRNASASHSRKPSVAGPGGTSFSTTSGPSGYSLNGGQGQREQRQGRSASSSTAAPRSRSKSGGSGKEGQARRYVIFGLANPRSGDGLASGFLTDYPPVNEKTIFLEEQRISVHVELRFFNVLEATERQNCLRQLESLIKESPSGVDATKKVVCIMGGDGSLATTIQFLRTSLTIDACLQRGRLSFCMLPFGTGNDGAQVFGWGSSPCSEFWL